jgi:hypothetical protein
MKGREVAGNVETLTSCYIWEKMSKVLWDLKILITQLLLSAHRQSETKPCVEQRWSESSHHQPQFSSL